MQEFISSCRKSVECATKS